MGYNEQVLYIKRHLASEYAWGFLMGIIVTVLMCGVAFAQTAILTPQGGYLCLPGSMTTICGSTTPNDNLTILQLGPQTYAVTPMAPAMPQYDEPKQPRPSSTPFFLGPSEAKPERLFEAETPKIPCYSLYRDC